MSRIMVTGADGFLGSHLIDFLISKGFEIVATIQPNHPVRNLTQYLSKDTKNSINGIKKSHQEDYFEIPTNNHKLRIIYSDIRDKETIEKIISNEKPQLIYHFAAQPFVLPSWKDPAYTIETNVNGTINIFEAIKKFKITVKVLNACSSAEYGTTTNLNRPLNEKDPLLALHPYGISKVATELLARQYFTNFGIECVNLRFFNQTGPRKVNDACSDFTKAIAKIELDLMPPIINVGNLNPYRDITGIKDTLQAIWIVTNKGIPGETYNICSGRKIQIREVLSKILKMSSKEIKVIENTPEKLRNIDEDIILGDNTKIKKLGFQNMQTIHDLLREMVDYWIDFYQKKEGL